MLGQVVQRLVEVVAEGDAWFLLEAGAIALGVVALVVRSSAPRDGVELGQEERGARLKKARVQHVLARAGQKAEADLTAVEFSDLTPSDVANLAATSLKIAVSPRVDTVDALLELPRLSSLTVAGDGVLSRKILATIEQLPALRSLDLRASPVVIDNNNSAAGLCKVTDVFQFQQRRKLPLLQLPSRCAVQVGQVVHVFPKAGVIVVHIHLPVSVGDAIQLRRVNRTFSTATTREFARASSTAAAGHRWTSEVVSCGHCLCATASRLHAPVRRGSPTPALLALAAGQTVIDSIRTDDHQQLQTALPVPDSPLSCVDSQVALRVKEVGLKGDTVWWLGHGQPE